MKYNVIYADPPWPYKNKSFGLRPGRALSKSFSPEVGRYSTMEMKDIENLPIRELQDRDCALLMWATSPFLPEALGVIKSWGFEYKTIAFVWSKIYFTGKEAANLGKWTLSNVEIVLLATKGSPKRCVNNVRQFVQAERTKHSKKPDEVRKRIENLFGDVPRIELFAREKFPGWHAWGNEIESDIELEYKNGV